MEKLNKHWQEFNFGDLFWYKRGKRFITSEQVEGDIPYISSTKKNNGIDNYITPPDFMKVYRNALTLNNSGSVGYCFYHPYNFVASDHCTVIGILDERVTLNVYIATFLKPVIEAMKVKYNFAREISDERLGKEKIELPVTKKGNPDWGFMENYIKKVSSDIVYNKNISKRKKERELNISGWKDFELSFLFEIKKGKRLTKEEFTEGDTPFIGAIDSDNGYREFIGQGPIHQGNTITVNYNGSVAEAFYQPNSFWASDDVNVLYPKFEMTPYSALFITSIIKMEKFRFNYGRKWNLERMEVSTIKLPIDKMGNPDFTFMENYIRSINYSTEVTAL